MKNEDSNKSICAFMYDKVQKDGMDEVLLKYTPEDFHIGQYNRS